MAFQDMTRTTFHRGFSLQKGKLPAMEALLRCCWSVQREQPPTAPGGTDAAVLWAALPSKHWPTNPICQITILVFHGLLLTATHHCWVKLPRHCVPRSTRTLTLLSVFFRSFQPTALLEETRTGRREQTLVSLLTQLLTYSDLKNQGLCLGEHRGPHKHIFALSA